MTKSATSGASATVAIPQSFGLVENQAYTMSARTYDGLDDSPLSVACPFTIDSTGPQSPPTVTSADYPECTATACESAGGVGKSGLFTLGAHGVADIMQYRYWFDGGPKVTTAAVAKGGGATVRIDPPPLEETLHLEDLTRGGPRTLHVVSVDQAGRESGEYTSGAGDDSVGGYKILAGSAPTAEAWWKLDEPAGSAVATDSTSHAHDLTTAGTVSNVEGSGDGGSAYSFGLSGTAQGPLAVDLRGSRTTVATVRLSAATGESTIVRHTKYGDPFLQDELYFDGATKKVCYRVQVGAATTANPPPRGEWEACAAAPSTLGTWLRVAGGFDAMRREAFVSVDGTRTASSVVAAYTAPTTGTGGLTALGDKELVGAADDVRVWNRQLRQNEIGALAVADAGRWDLDSSVEDATENQVKHPLDDSGPSDERWNDFGHVEGDLGSAYFGGTSSLSTSGRVLRTDQSFSVSAWVSLHKVPTNNMTVLAQDGTVQSAFYLGVRQWGTTPRWAFSMQNADSASTVAFTHAISTTDAVTDDDVGGWVHLVGVYDASAQTQTLYVNGVHAQTTARTARWQADGPLAIGRALYTPANGTTAQVDKIEGSVDAVRAYAGVLTPDMVERLYETQDGQL